MLFQNAAVGYTGRERLHPDRYEKDSEKDYWLKKSGILCIQHYTAERCYNETAQVVDEFLSILKQHEK